MFELKGSCKISGPSKNSLVGFAQPTQNLMIRQSLLALKGSHEEYKKMDLEPKLK
jgi:hypothetical protein